MKMDSWIRYTPSYRSFIGLSLALPKTRDIIYVQKNLNMEILLSSLTSLLNLRILLKKCFGVVGCRDVINVGCCRDCESENIFNLLFTISSFSLVNYTTSSH